METRPKRTVKRVDYRELADVRLPKRVKVKPNTNDSSEKLYRLLVLESDTANALVRVRYVGYDSIRMTNGGKQVI